MIVKDVMSKALCVFNTSSFGGESLEFLLNTLRFRLVLARVKIMLKSFVL